MTYVLDYIHVKSSHPPSVVKQLPKMVNKRISDLSCDESAFNNAKVTYELALKYSGYKSEMKFDRQQSTRKNRKTAEKLPKNHIFRKIFNLNTLKLSYSSMANLQSLKTTQR